MAINSYDSMQAKLATAIDDFKSSIGSRVDSYYKAQATPVSEAAWESFSTSRQELIDTLAILALAIHKKLPKKEMEDTFGAEVQEEAIKMINEGLGKLRGGEKETIVSYSKYLGELATLAKAKKDRPDDYPADLDQKQKDAVDKNYSRSLADNYTQMISIVTAISFFLTTNADLIQKPKRTYQVM
eukprot:TRINITY_DN30430_c0_g1_i1.p1 TRINITY_DN30430_c0_g1~~TRINITY_DN30430_c0_g1_i1.p1  ORF type:complete len:185 (+),score=53.31 TRINITY_DN30430_c0_g1_i1:65-619(+)